MKKMLFAFIVCLSAGLSACTSSQPTQGILSTSQMTQPIVTDNGLDTASNGSVGTSSQPDAASDVISGAGGIPTPDASASPAKLEDILNQYYNTKAQVSALSIDIDILEADFRIGKIESAFFQEQKAALLTQKMKLERDEDLLEHQADLLTPYTAPDLTNTDVAALLEQFHEAEVAEDAFDLEEDILKEHYRSGQISRADFISQKAVLERKSDEADNRADMLEDTLELLGWDD